MFTGIVTDIGTIMLVTRNNDMRARIATAYAVEGIDIGASIACDGVCLTVVDRGRDAEQGWFDVDISAETLSKTNILSNRSPWQPGKRINLERALRVGDELGGHIVSGHVDGLAEVLSSEEVDGSICLTLRAPADLAKFIAEKGSVALGGTSLTVNRVDGAEFTINLIPHTRTVTTWGDVTPGDMVNLEIDTLARYVGRLNDMLV